MPRTTDFAAWLLSAVSLSLHCLAQVNILGCMVTEFLGGVKVPSNRHLMGEVSD